jgi:hypothetical protein
MYNYWGFGLHISSEIEFPELMPATFANPDVLIKIGKTPANIEGPDVVHKVKVSMSPGEYLLDMGNTARYYATGGNTIIIDPGKNADLESVRLFLLSNVMAAIIHQQNLIPLHASGLITSRGVALFTGPSGMGKSTTAYGMMQHGFKLFCDDVCVLSLNNSTSAVEAVASYPMLKLWENTLREISFAKTERVIQVRPDLPKKGLLLHDRFSNIRYPVQCIYVLKTDSLEREISVRKLNRVDAFNQIQQNTYRRKQVDMMQLRESHFEMITRLVNQADVFEIIRPSGDNKISEFIEFTKTHLDSYATS